MIMLMLLMTLTNGLIQELRVRVKLNVVKRLVVLFNLQMVKNQLFQEFLRNFLRRKRIYRAKIKTTEDPFKKKVYDGLQLAYKLTANSLYGQIGAPTSAIYLKDIAASTTKLLVVILHLAKDKTLEHYPQAEIVCGDTDSVSLILILRMKKQVKQMEGKASAIEKSIGVGVGAEKYIQQFLKPPQDLNMRRHSHHLSCFQRKDTLETNMKKMLKTTNNKGIVLKRRDNADIVKHVYGTIIDILINKLDLKVL